MCVPSEIPIFDALNEVAGVVPAVLIEQRPCKPLRQQGQQVRVIGTMIRLSYELYSYQWWVGTSLTCVEQPCVICKSMGGVWRAPSKSVEITLWIQLSGHVSDDDLLLTRSPSHSTKVVPSNQRNALALNTISRHALILIDGRGRECWCGEEICIVQ